MEESEVKQIESTIVLLSKKADNIHNKRGRRSDWNRHMWRKYMDAAALLSSILVELERRTK
jgi:hypothetical protein